MKKEKPERKYFSGFSFIGDKKVDIIFKHVIIISN